MLMVENRPNLPSGARIPVSIVELSRAFLGFSQKPGVIVVLAAFFDDSGTHAGSPVVVLGGLLGTEEQWNAFGAAWGDLLDRPLPGKPPLKQFHLSHIRGGHGEFADYTDAEQDHVTYLFRQVILNTGLVSLAAAVNRNAWNELVVGALADELGQPEHLCFVKCIEQVIQTVRLGKPGDKVVIAFDQGVQKKLEQWAAYFSAESDKYPEIAGIGFAKVSEVLALQGADLIATETYQFNQAWLENRDSPRMNPHFNDFIMRDLSAGLVFDRPQIEEMIERAKERIPHLR
jgi:hypothetical protein